MISLLPAHAPGFFPSPFETGKGYHMLSADSKFNGVYLFAIFHYRMPPTLQSTGSTNQECLAKRAAGLRLFGRYDRTEPNRLKNCLLPWTRSLVKVSPFSTFLFRREVRTVSETEYHDRGLQKRFGPDLMWGRI